MSEELKCKKGKDLDPCGLCKNPDYTECWYDVCADPKCGEIRIEHRYGFYGEFKEATEQ